MRWILLLIPLIMISTANALNIVVTFSNLKEDMKLIAPNDTIVSIVKPGVDPHSYQLTPKDVNTLKRADIIISTAHAPFELKIRELVESGEIKARLVEIPRIPGIVLLKNPMTGKPNLHMPIYDPHNYEVFLKYVAKALSHLNPGGDYLIRAERVCREVDNIIEKTRKLNALAVADQPESQYAVHWLNVTIVGFLVREPELPALPNDVRRIEREMSKVQLAVVLDTKTQASETLRRLAEEHGVPVLVIPSPIEDLSVIKKLEIISREVNELKKPERKSPGFEVALCVLALLLAVKKCS